MSEDEVGHDWLEGNLNGNVVRRCCLSVTVGSSCPDIELDMDYYLGLTLLVYKTRRRHK